jgi:hypothetical protein
MSRTHKTAPLSVKLRNGTARRMEIHDHSDGPCELPPEPPSGSSGVDHSTRCFWDFHYEGRNVFCGCAMCTDQDARRQERRRQRHEFKSTIRHLDPDEI